MLFQYATKWTREYKHFQQNAVLSIMISEIERKMVEWKKAFYMKEVFLSYFELIENALKNSKKKHEKN